MFGVDGEESIPGDIARDPSAGLVNVPTCVFAVMRMRTEIAEAPSRLRSYPESYVMFYSGTLWSSKEIIVRRRKYGCTHRNNVLLNFFTLFKKSVRSVVDTIC